MNLIVGFTGTRVGMTNRQTKAFEILAEKLCFAKFIHGGCRGADTEADTIIKKLNPFIDIEVRPGDNHQEWYFMNSSRILLPVKPYLERNRDIVNACDILIATPKQIREPINPRAGGGTWYTIRYARSVGKPTIILEP